MACRVKSLKLSEDDLQKQIVAFLKLHGYTVMVTSRRVKRCQKCGAFPQSGRGDGVSKGVPDLLVRHPKWPAGLMLGLEVKRPGTVRYSSLEQKAAALVGDIIVVQSLEDVADACRSVRIELETV